MDEERTDEVFITTWRGRAIAFPLLKFGEAVVPEGFGNDPELTRRWEDFRLARELRTRGVPVVSPSLLIAGVVVPDHPAYHK